MTIFRQIQCVCVLGALGAVAAQAAAQALVVPTVADPLLQGYLNQMARDYASIRGDIAAAFAPPKEALALPCDVPREQLLAIVAAVGLADESPQVRRSYLRSMRVIGADYLDSEYHFDDVEVRAVRAACKNGKLDGDVELWAAGTRVENSALTITRQKFQRRVRLTVEEGRPVGAVRRWTRGGAVVEWRDPATAAMMNNGENKLVDAWSVEYRPLDVEAPAVAFSFVELSNPRTVDESITVRSPLPNGGYETSTYKQQQLFSTQRHKNGVAHGLMVVYPIKGGMIDQRIVRCYRNGEPYMADPCDVD